MLNNVNQEMDNYKCDVMSNISLENNDNRLCCCS